MGDGNSITLIVTENNTNLSCNHPIELSIEVDDTKTCKSWTTTLYTTTLHNNANEV